MTQVFNLVKRTSFFGKNIILLAKKLPQSIITIPLISQLIRSATSVGANYMEAEMAESKKDFIHKIGICAKEAKETQHWLYMLSIALPEYNTECISLYKESRELSLIFHSIRKNSQ